MANNSQTKFYLALGAIAVVGAGFIGYVATRDEPGSTPVTVQPLEDVGTTDGSVPLEAAVIKGSEDAPVLIEEYADLLCPYCGMYAQLTLPQIMERYVETGKVRYAFFDFPVHPGEVPILGAEAGRCAGEQGAYWPMHDVLFARMREWSTRRDPIPYFRQYADALGLDAGALKECVDSRKYRDAVMTTRRRGEQMGVDRTPTFFINGRRVTGALGFDQFSEIIEEELAKR